MNRRKFIEVLGMGAATGAFAIASSAIAAEHNHGHISIGSLKKRRPLSKELLAVVDTSNKCVANAEACLARCNESLLAGDTSMADCQTVVMDMIAICEALKRVAINNTSDEVRIKVLAKLCGEYCRDCEKECKPHASHHAECKACLESCVECAKACESYVRV
jgi:Cys-rich four helix bundle protein (predicted Tat secretion target)